MEIELYKDKRGILDKNHFQKQNTNAKCFNSINLGLFIIVLSRKTGLRPNQASFIIHGVFRTVDCKLCLDLDKKCKRRKCRHVKCNPYCFIRKNYCCRCNSYHEEIDNAIYCIKCQRCMDANTICCNTCCHDNTCDKCKDILFSICPKCKIVARKFSFYSHKYYSCMNLFNQEIIAYIIHLRYDNCSNYDLPNLRYHIANNSLPLKEDTLLGFCDWNVNCEGIEFYQDCRCFRCEYAIHSPDSIIYKTRIKYIPKIITNRKFCKKCNFYARQNAIHCKKCNYCHEPRSIYRNSCKF